MRVSVDIAGNKLCLATDQAAYFLEVGLFFGTKRMGVLTFCIELGMSASKLLICVDCRQMEISFELVPHEAAWGLQAFQH